MTIDDFNEAIGTQLPQDGPRTLAGLVFDALGRRPEPGDEVELDGVRITVERVEGLRITRLLVTLPRERARRLSARRTSPLAASPPSARTTAMRPRRRPRPGVRPVEIARGSGRGRLLVWRDRRGPGGANDSRPGRPAPRPGMRQHEEQGGDEALQEASLYGSSP